MGHHVFLSQVGLGQPEKVLLSELESSALLPLLLGFGADLGYSTTNYTELSQQK